MNKVVIVVIILSSAIIGCVDSERTDSLSKEIELLEIENDSLKKITTSCYMHLDSLKLFKNSIENYWFDIDLDGNQIDKPEEFIESSLRARLEMIPIEGDLGGTMSFGKIQILGKNWIIAEYCDGHFCGRSIYKYRLNEDNLIEFEILDSAVY